MTQGRMLHRGVGAGPYLGVDRNQISPSARDPSRTVGTRLDSTDRGRITRRNRDGDRAEMGIQSHWPFLDRLSGTLRRESITDGSSPPAISPQTIQRILYRCRIPARISAVGLGDFRIALARVLREVWSPRLVREVHRAQCFGLRKG